ncbi:MAG: GNAT family N-acetyltransferase, partial [Actinomycetota bacterium]
MSAIGLRAVVATDAEWIHRACQDPEIQRWTTVPRPYTIDHARFFVADTTLEYRRWVIEGAEGNVPLGLLGIHSVQPDTGDADIGYWVARWGRGLGAGAAAVRAMTEIARTDGAISCLVAYVA